MNIDDSYLSKKYDFSFKLVVLGECSVGKSSIIDRFINNSFSDTVASTLGVAFSNKILIRKGEKINLEIWDTAGQERFRNIAPLYYRKASAVLIVFDLTNKYSFDQCSYWVKEIDLKGNPHSLKILVGNKSDLLEKNINNEEIICFSKENDLLYMEVSAKNGHNVEKMFKRISRFLLKRYKFNSEEIKINNIENRMEKKYKCCNNF